MLKIAYAQQPSHTYALKDLQDLLETAGNGDWQRSLDQGLALGKQIFQMLNGSGGILAQALDKAFQEGYPLLLQVDTPSFLDVLPFELLYDRSFLALQGNAAPGQKRRPSAVRLRHEHLESTQVKILKEGFIGRRRPLQNGLAVLKGNKDGKCGMLLHGPAGVGKSCLAGKLLSGFPDAALLVIHGELKSVKLPDVLQTTFDRVGFQPGLDALRSDKEWEEKLKAVFRACIRDMPLLILLDDFEQNLEPLGPDHKVSPPFLTALKVLLERLEWGQGRLQLLITSRYPFGMEAGGRDLPRDLLLEIPFVSFYGADLTKNLAQLEHIRKRLHADWYLQVGQGNPRLMEWLNILAQKETGKEGAFDPAVLQTLGEKDVRESVAEILARTQGTEFLDFLCQAAVFRGPVPADAFQGLGPEEFLQSILDKMESTHFEQGIADKNEGISILLNNLGIGWKTLGDGPKAIRYYEQALAIDLKVFGPEHPSTQTISSNWESLEDNP